MKTAALAALAASTVSAAPTCMPGVKAMIYTDDTCKTDNAAATTVWASVLALATASNASNDTCYPLPGGGSIKLSCDTTALTTMQYASNDCTGDAAGTYPATWGKCTMVIKATDANQYAMFTSAAKLQAAVAAGLAIAVSYM